MDVENVFFDIFIAYHGDNQTGTEREACDLQEKINNYKLGNDKINSFCYPITCPYGNFSETPRIVARTPLFLLLINKNIPLNEHGQIKQRNANGELKYLYQEIAAFRESEYYKKSEKGLAAKILICDDFELDGVRGLDPMFSGDHTFQGINDHTINEIIEWILKDKKRRHANNDIQLQQQETHKEDGLLSKIEWDANRAKVWHKMKSPSRPSVSELENYKKYFRLVKRHKTSANQAKALVLGSTVELRKLAYLENFEVTVVDYSESYYNEINKELPDFYDLSQEHFYSCNWCEMSKTVSGKFDIIIGDLAVGNIPPQQIDSFFENIKALLNEGGYYLGKSIYKYSNYEITEEEIDILLDNMAYNENITKDNIYEYIMYSLSLYSSEPYSFENEDHIYKINFQNLYNVVKRKVDSLPPKYKDKFSIYIDETTKFDEKMPKEFFVYGYDFILKKLSKYELYLVDTIYSDDVYKDDFPLLIIKNKKPKIQAPISVNTFLGHVHDDYINIWENSISASYFLYAIGNFIHNDSLLRHIIQLFNNAEIVVNDELNYFLKTIPEDSMDKETQSIVKNTELSEIKSLPDELQLNYTCGIVSNLIYHCKTTRHIDANLLDLVLSTLFANKNQPGKIWRPHKSPWLSARICISLFPIYEEWKKHKNTRRDNDIAKIEEVVSLLAEEDISESGLFWKSETGSHFDTSALCIETLYLYENYLKNKNTCIQEKIESILDNYVRHNRIQETFIKFPISYSLIEAVCDNKQINGKEAYKKMSGRIEWFTIIYKICLDWGKKNQDNELLEAGKYIAKQLKHFWQIFNLNYEKLIQMTIEQEKSCIPQILYCLKGTELF